MVSGIEWYSSYRVFHCAEYILFFSCSLNSHYDLQEKLTWIIKPIYCKNELARTNHCPWQNELLSLWQGRQFLLHLAYYQLWRHSPMSFSLFPASASPCPLFPISFHFPNSLFLLFSFTLASNLSKIRFHLMKQGT